MPEPALPMIAQALNLSRARSMGLLIFYHDFRREPAGKHVLKLCGAEACRSMGGDHIAACAEKSLGIELGSTSSDGQVTLEHVYCLGFAPWRRQRCSMVALSVASMKIAFRDCLRRRVNDRSTLYPEGCRGCCGGSRRRCFRSAC